MGDDVLDVEAAVDDAAWARRMGEALRPPPEAGQCAACGRWAVEDDACVDCGAAMEVTP